MTAATPGAAPQHDAAPDELASMTVERDTWRECVIELFGLAETVSDDPEYVGLVRSPGSDDGTIKAGQWCAYHIDYPEEGVLALDAGAAGARRCILCTRTDEHHHDPAAEMTAEDKAAFVARFGSPGETCRPADAAPATCPMLDGWRSDAPVPSSAPTIAEQIITRAAPAMVVCDRWIHAHRRDRHGPNEYEACINPATTPEKQLSGEEDEAARLWRRLTGSNCWCHTRSMGDVCAAIECEGCVVPLIRAALSAKDAEMARWEADAREILADIPERISVREGGADENLRASLALSVAAARRKAQSSLAAALARVEVLESALADVRAICGPIAAEIADAALKGES